MTTLTHNATEKKDDVTLWFFFPHYSLAHLMVYCSGDEVILEVDPLRLNEDARTIQGEQIDQLGKTFVVRIRTK